MDGHSPEVSITQDSQPEGKSQQPSKPSVLKRLEAIASFFRNTSQGMKTAYKDGALTSLEANTPVFGRPEIPQTPKQPPKKSAA